MHNNNGWGCCFVWLNFPPLLCFLPVCPLLHAPNVKQNLGTWNGIWCHITQHTRIQKNLTARRVNLEWRQASSYLLAKVPQCQSSARSAVRPPASLQRSHTNTLAPSTPMTLGDDRETEGLCLAEPLPAPQHILYSSRPNLRAKLHRYILIGCLLIWATCKQSVWCCYSVFKPYTIVCILKYETMQTHTNKH